MAKVAAKADQDFRQNLKRVQSTKFTVEDEKDVSEKVKNYQLHFNVIISPR